MNASELRQKSADELTAELDRLQKEHFEYRMSQASGQLGQAHLLGETRRAIARVKTVLNEKRAQQ